MNISRKLNNLDWAIRFVSVIVIVIGGYWLLGWLNGFTHPFFPHWSEAGKITMKTNMSLSLVILGTVLLLVGLPVHSKIPARIAAILSTVVLVTGVMLLIENIFNIDLGIDQLLAAEPFGETATASPNRVGFVGSLCLTLLGSGFLLLITGKRKQATFMGLLVFIISLIPAFGYLLEITIFYSLPRLTAIAWPTVISMLLMGLGLLFVRPGDDLKNLMFRNDPGDILIRRMLPVIILIPPVIGLVAVSGEKILGYDTITSTGIQAFILITLLGWMSFRTRKIINRINASRRFSENSLRESEKKYRLIFETANEGIWITDGNRVTIMANQRLSDMLGYSKSEIMGKKPADFLFGDQEEFRQETIENLKSGNKTSGEFKFRRKDGSILWVISNASPVLDNNGQLIRTVSMLTDITNRKLAENELLLAREKLNLALESGNIGVWEWNLKTNETNWDERMHKIFGLEPGSFGNSYKDFQNLIHEEDVWHMEKVLGDTLYHGAAYVNLYRTRPIDGKVKYITSRAVINKFENGKPVNLIGVCFDVTWLREETEHTILKLNEELLRSNKELENFAYIASHDLQEPLRMVSCFTQLLSQQYQGNLDNRAREYIHYAVEGSNRMYELLNGLLAYSRIHTKGKEFTEIDTMHIISDVLKNLALKIQERNAVVEFNDLPVIHADGTQMIQLFQNLISNAIKFSPENPVITITSKLEKG